MLSGDGRCDSPGKPAKYCIYSVMEISENKILHFENVDKREVHLQSLNMEREGMVYWLNFLISKGMTITELVTDFSSSVASTLGKYITWVMYHVYCEFAIPEREYNNIHHSYDVWHKAKKLKKGLSELRRCINYD